ncbi:hypothetical protein D3C87_1312470 [compost metagenome]
MKKARLTSLSGLVLLYDVLVARLRYGQNPPPRIRTFLISLESLVSGFCFAVAGESCRFAGRKIQNITLVL